MKNKSVGKLWSFIIIIIINKYMYIFFRKPYREMDDTFLEDNFQSGIGKR